jgi:hypothetical protein
MGPHLTLQILTAYWPQANAEVASVAGSSIGQIIEEEPARKP